MTLHVPRVPGWVKACYLGVVVLVFGWALADAIPQVRQWHALLLRPHAYVFIVAWAAMAFLLGAWWALLLRWDFAARLALREWLPIQAMAWGGRYLPGKLGLFAGKLAVLGRHGLDARKLAYSVIWEQLAFVCSGFVAAALFMSAALPHSPLVLAAHWGVLRAAIIVALPVCFLALTRFLKRRLDSQSVQGGMGIGRELWLLGLYLLPHLAIGAGCYPLLLVFLPQAAPLGCFGLVGLLALANVSGILAIFAPAGIGVREAVLGFGLGAYVPLPEALAFAALLRLLSLIADALFFLMAGGASWLWKTKRARAP